MNPREFYPTDYRSEEVKAIKSAVRAGECVSLVGLSGSGKSNLLAFLASQSPIDSPCFVLVDCNRLEECSGPALIRLMYRSLGASSAAAGSLGDLEIAIADRLELSPAGLCLLFDRFDAVATCMSPAIYGNLRALRDAQKYVLTYVTATRRPMDPTTELAELFYANSIWLGPLCERDARWSVVSYAEREGLVWDDGAINALITLTSGYPALLRAACEAYADGCNLQANALAGHPAVRRRLAEFWADGPGETELRLSGLLGQPLLMAGHPERQTQVQEDSELTAKEHLLLNYFRAHPSIVCEKDDLIRAVWPEDRIFEQGIRDDSLAQLVRRLRTKIEADPSQPQYIHTVPGRGYRFIPGK